MAIPGVHTPTGVILEMIDRLEADDAFAGVLVRWGLLSKLPSQRERIYLLGTDNYLIEPNDRGHVVRVETFDVLARLEVHQIAQDPARVDQRLGELLRAVDDVLTADSDLIAAHYALRFEASTRIYPASDGWIAVADASFSMEGAR